MSGKKFFRVVQYLSKEKIEEFKSTSASDRLCWLESANTLIYKTYINSGNPEPYDPRLWPFLP